MGVLNGNFSPRPPQQYDAAGVHVWSACSCNRSVSCLSVLASAHPSYSDGKRSQTEGIADNFWVIFVPSLVPFLSYHFCAISVLFFGPILVSFLDHLLSHFGVIFDSFLDPV